MDDAYRALWSEVVLQAIQDIALARYRSAEYDEAVAFFSSSGWAESRIDIAGYLDVHPDDLAALGCRKITARRQAEGDLDIEIVPPVHNSAKSVGLHPNLAKAKLEQPLPQIVAIAAPERKRRSSDASKRPFFYCGGQQASGVIIRGQRTGGPAPVEKRALDTAVG